MKKKGTTFLPRQFFIFVVPIVIAAGCTRGQGQIVNLEATPSPAIATSAMTAEPTNTPISTPSPATRPTTVPRQRLTICQADEPTTLYFYDHISQAARNIWGAIYDGPIDNRNYSYQPVILEKLPNFQDGDASIEDIVVNEGDIVVNSDGHAVVLSPGTMVDLLARETMSPSQTVYPGGSLVLQKITAEFKILERVTWSDGEPVTAEDSVFSFRMAQLRDQKSQATEYSPQGWENPDLSERTEAYQALDESTVLWTGLPGYYDPTYFLNFYPPLPSHQLNQFDPRWLSDTEQATRFPLGWGPFRIVEWEPGKEIRLERNPYYFRSNEGLPFVDEVVFRFVLQEDQLSALLDGRCQVGTQHGAFPFVSRLDEYLELERSGLLQVEQAPNMRLYLWFGIDKQDSLAGYFEDARVRQAVAYGVNRQALADAIPQAVGPQPDSYLPPGHPYHDERALNHYPYDPERARELLEEAGWVDTDQDGVLDKAGLPFHANAIVREGDSEAIQVIQLVGQDLEKIGIKIEITRVATEEYYANHSEAPLFGRKYDLYLFRGGGVSTRPDCKVFSSAAIPGPGNDWKGLNLAGYSNSEFDAACLAGLASLDPERARDFHIEAQRIFSQDLPALPLFITPKFSITSPEVSGFIIDPASEDSELWMMEEIRLEAVP